MEWISVDDRLPDERAWVLCATSDTFTKYYSPFGDFKQVTLFLDKQHYKRPMWVDGDGDCYELDIVTDWMPLPPLPGMVGSGKADSSIVHGSDARGGDGATLVTSWA